MFRHYWVLVKFLITIPSTIVLLLHMQPISRIAGVAAETTLSSADLRALRIQLVANAGAALLVLLVATTLSVYKPRGMTAYGRRKQYEDLDDGGVASKRGATASRPRWAYVSAIIAVVLVLLFVVLHLTGGGLHGH